MIQKTHKYCTMLLFLISQRNDDVFSSPIFILFAFNYPETRPSRPVFMMKTKGSPEEKGNETQNGRRGERRHNGKLSSSIRDYPLVLHTICRHNQGPNSLFDKKTEREKERLKHTQPILSGFN